MAQVAHVPVGAKEIAAHLGVAVSTVYQWQVREQFLPPKWTVSGRPAWDLADVLRWDRARTRS